MDKKTINIILEKAKLYNIEIFENEEFAKSLLVLGLDEEIKPKLNKGLIKLFTYLVKIEKKSQIS